jgi:PTS system ascorbate-specific IIB component
MKIIAVCGMGIGTSVLLKMNTEKVLRKLGVDADVEAADIGVARGMARDAEIVLTSQELVSEIGSVDAEVIVIENFFDLAEIEDKLNGALEYLS